MGRLVAARTAGPREGPASSALAQSARRPLRSRLIASLIGTDPILWHNTTRGLQLFMDAAFGGLAARGIPVRHQDRTKCALFCFGATDAATSLAHLSPYARRRTELALLRQIFDFGRREARRVRRELHYLAGTRRDDHATTLGRTALRDWLRGCDPASRLADLLEDAVLDPPASRDRSRAPLRQRPPRPEPLRARRQTR